jgi:hypothetical protein
VNQRAHHCGISLVGLALLAGIASACGAGPKRFESELTAFREGIFRQFPDLEDSTMNFTAMMTRLDSLCESFLSAHKLEADAAFDARLRELPELRDVDTSVYVRADTMPLDGFSGYETYLQPHAAILKMTNLYPEAMTSSYRTLLLAHEQGASWLGQYYMLNSIGKPIVGRSRLDRNRAVIFMDTWLDFTRLELARQDNHWQAQRIERWIRRRK